MDILTYIVIYSMFVWKMCPAKLKKICIPLLEHCKTGSVFLVALIIILKFQFLIFASNSENSWPTHFVAYIFYLLEEKIF